MHFKNAVLVYVVSSHLHGLVAAAPLPASRRVIAPSIGPSPVRKPDWSSRPTMSSYWKDSVVDHRESEQHNVLAERLSSTRGEDISPNLSHHKRLVHPKKVLRVLVVGARAVTRCVINKCRSDWTYKPPIPNDRVKPVKVLPPERPRRHPRRGITSRQLTEGEKQRDEELA